MSKILATGVSTLLGLGLGALLQGPPDGGPSPRPPEAKKKGGPERELRKTYDLLRRLRGEEGPVSRPEERLRDLTERATEFYRKAIETQGGEGRAAHEYGVAAHDLARAVEHARNAARLDRPDPELPPPPAGHGPESIHDRSRHDLRRAYDRIHELREQHLGGDADFYLGVAGDLYTDARRDAEDDRDDRAGELARAAEALTHVPEHLARAEGRGEPPKARGERDDEEKGPRDEPKRKHERPAPPKEKGERPAPPTDELPPPLHD